MKLKTFLAFVSPSVLAMILLIAVPLIGVMYLSVYNSYIKTEIVEVTSTVPTFAGMKQTKVEKVPQPVLDEDGNPVKITEYVGSQNFVSVADPAGLAAAFSKDRSLGRDGSPASLVERLQGIYRDVIDIDFWGALEFTLLYAFITTPCILVLGFLVALAVNSVAQWMRGPLIFTSLLPFIITPVVGSLSIYWLFLDNAVIAALLEQMFDTKVYFLKDAITIRSLIILYGVWHVTPFAFVILYAGLQTVPSDALQAAMVDGANFWQRIWYVVIPHLAPAIRLHHHDPHHGRLQDLRADTRVRLQPVRQLAAVPDLLYSQFRRQLSQGGRLGNSDGNRYLHPGQAPLCSR